MRSLSFEEFRTLSQQGNLIPVFEFRLADLLTPVSALMRLQRASRQAFLLESVEGGEKVARYSFLGCHPRVQISAIGKQIHVKTETSQDRFHGNFFEYLKNHFSSYRPAYPAGLPRFSGGAVGYVGYETITLIEDVPVYPPSDQTTPDAWFMIFDTIVAFDHLSHGAYVISNVVIEEAQSLRRQYDAALSRIAEVNEMLDSDAADESMVVTAEPPLSELRSNFRRQDFEAAVAAAKSHIEAGDIFQIVLSQHFSKPIATDPLQIYRALRIINPSPYLFYVNFGDLAIIGSSPELLVRVDEGIVEVRPIAGTRRRGDTPEEDQSLAAELRADAKEVAEHIMLVDLGRNDLGRVSHYGSVEVTESMSIERYSHVMHLVSNVRGKLRAEFSALDALQACFPAGTVSGAPKIKAMELIHKLEPERRGVYSGALGYFDFSGNLDTCIAIRTLVVKDGIAHFQAGAGIVADSIPEREYQETISKATALKAALELAERGLQ